MKTEIYESLAVVNRATDQITEHLWKLASLKILTPTFVQFRIASLEEIRAHVNLDVALKVADAERDEAAKFEDQRLDIEKRLREST